MNVLIVPMFALSRMGGPWSRAQTIAAAFEAAGHHVVLGMAADGNCTNPCVEDALELPVPSPLGLPMAIASRTFPIAEKLGISGRKPVHSFEEVLWLTGALAYKYERETVTLLRRAIEERHIDAVYSEFSLPAIIAAKAAGVPVFGSFSYPTQTSYASNPGKAGGVRILVAELELPGVESSLELFDWLDWRFVPSCKELEPFEDVQTEFVGFLKEPPVPADIVRDCIVIYLGSGSVPKSEIERVAAGLAVSDIDVYVAGAKSERSEGRVHFAPRFDFSELLPRAKCFVNHGGQNSVMDALAYDAPQVIVPGQVFERIYNAQSIEQAGAGLTMGHFDAETLQDAIACITTDRAYEEAAAALRAQLASLGGAEAVVRKIEGFV